MEKEEKTKEKRGKKSEMRNRDVGKMLWNWRRGGGKSELNFPPGSEACPWSLRGQLAFTGHVQQAGALHVYFSLTTNFFSGSTALQDL